VVAVDRVNTLPPAVTRGLPDHELSYVSGDLSEPCTMNEALARVTGTVDILHAAAIINFNQLASTLGSNAPRAADVLRSFDVNALLPVRLCATLAEQDRLRRMIHVSTRAVFGGRPATTEPISEDEPVQPAGVYGCTKAAAELGIAALRQQFGLDIRVARITGAYGPWQGAVSWIGQAVDSIIAGRKYRARAGSADGYELTYIKDVVRGLVALLELPDPRHDIYHVSSGGSLTTLGSVAAALNELDPSADVDFGPGSVAAAAGRTPLSTVRINEELGYRPRWQLANALADYLAVERTGNYGPEATNARV
jgi:nucleoside-diphosphate-sugar epimerase